MGTEEDMAGLPEPVKESLRAIFANGRRLHKLQIEDPAAFELEMQKLEMESSDEEPDEEFYRQQKKEWEEYPARMKALFPDEEAAALVDHAHDEAKDSVADLPEEAISARPSTPQDAAFTRADAGGPQCGGRKGEAVDRPDEQVKRQRVLASPEIAPPFDSRPPEVKWAEAMDEIYITVQLPDAKDTIVKWAQAIDKVYITVQLPDAIDTTVNLEPEGTFTIRGNDIGADGRLYHLNLDLNDKVNVEASKTSVGFRSIVCIAEKGEAKWWKKLVRDDQKVPRSMNNDDGDK